jgi:hypothetical protein
VRFYFWISKFLGNILHGWIMDVFNFVYRNHDDSQESHCSLPPFNCVCVCATSKKSDSKSDSLLNHENLSSYIVPWRLEADVLFGFNIGIWNCRFFFISSDEMSKIRSELISKMDVNQDGKISKAEVFWFGWFACCVWLCPNFELGFQSCLWSSSQYLTL